jgi:Tol biopolymer transport system component
VEKLPADRFESAQAFIDALEDESFTYTARPVSRSQAAAPAAVAAPAAPRSRWATLLPWGVAAVLAVLLGLAALRPPPGTNPQTPMRVRLDDFDGVLGLPFGRNVAISRDGSAMAVVGLDESGYGLFLRRSDDPEFRLISATEDLGAVSPAFSPDGQWILFQDNDQLRKVSLAGGPVLPVAVGSYAHWASQEEIVFGDEDGLYRVSSSGGTSTLLVADSEVEGSVSRPFLLPGGRGLLFQRTVGAEGRWVMLMDLESGEITELAVGTDPSYSPTGHIVFGHLEQSLLALPFDLKSLSVRGSPVPVLPTLTVYTGGAAQYDFSDNGTLLYGDRGDATRSVQSELAWVDMQGNAEPLRLRADNPVHPRVDPAGRRITYLDGREVWVYDIETGANNQLTFAGSNEDPVWSHDGEYVYFTSERAGSLGQDGYRQRADGSAEAEPMWHVEGENEVLSASRDGRYVVVRDDDGTGVEGMDLMVFELGSDPAVFRDYLRGDWGESQASISPDGRWMVYVSSESGPGEVYVRGFPEPRGQWRVSDAGGRSPVWAPDGSALYYISADGEMVKVEVETDDNFIMVSRSRLFDFTYDPGPSGNVGYDIHPDGDRFLVRGRLGTSGNPIGDLYVVVNWFEELRTRMGRGD